MLVKPKYTSAQQKANTSLSLSESKPTNMTPEKYPKRAFKRPQPDFEGSFRVNTDGFDLIIAPFKIRDSTLLQPHINTSEAFVHLT